MAGRAARRLSVAPRNCLTVNALHEGRPDCRMAIAASRRNVELVDRGFGVIGGKNFMRAVAIGADRGLRRSLFDGASMHAFLVGDEGLGAFAVRLHQELLPMAPAAGIRNVAMIHWRLGIVGTQNLVCPSVTVLAACRRRFAGRARLEVGAVRISLLRILMALGAGDL